jgi:quinolinate synthase
MPVVTYVNSPASVKALSTICCTSSNAVAVVNSLDEDELLMTPDRNLAQYTASRTGKKIHLWDGFCPIHNNLTVEQVLAAKKAHPGAVFMAHPECRPEVLELADVILSTSGMIRYAAESDRGVFIVGTEMGMLYPIRKASPGKIFYPASENMVCQDMKRISLEDIVRSLETMQGEVRVPEKIRAPALLAVRRMIELPQ